VNRSDNLPDIKWELSDKNSRQEKEFARKQAKKDALARMLACTSDIILIL